MQNVNILSEKTSEFIDNFSPNHGSAGLQALYGVIQGGVFEDLRDESIAFNLKDNKFFGLAIGGSLGSSKKLSIFYSAYIKWKKKYINHKFHY